MDALSDPPAGPDGRWRVELLGTCEASSGDVRVVRFPSRAVALLLARLALRPRGAHGREELIELLWPGVDQATGRNRFRPALSALRSLLQPSGVGVGAVLTTDRSTLKLNAEAVSCDVLDFERAIRDGRLADARTLYRGELLPGHYDSWVIDERRRLQDLFEQLADAEDACGASHPSSGRKPAAHPPAERSAPPLEIGRPAATVTVHAPSYLSLFLGRSTEMAVCARLVAADRLVTLTGTGGCGKTRLAIELAQAPQRWLPGFDTVVFVDLAECRDASQLAERLRVAMRLPGGSTAALDVLTAHFHERRVLLILDNFEQLVDTGGPEAAAELLARLPSVHVLVTSRRALQLTGEREMGLVPFEVPALDDELTTAAAKPAVALFVDRARGVRADFHLTSANREDVLAVCRLLEGLPLALEIAASRVRTYALREMRRELAGGFELVTRPGSVPSAPRHRHASLHAAIAWSWRLLTPEAQTFLGDLTVFRGGFDAAAAGAVAGAPKPHALIDALVRDSLLAVAPVDDHDDGEGGHRFHLLESVRAFAHGQIDAMQAARARHAHRQHFLERATQVATAYRTVPEGALGNYVQALRTGLDDGEPGLTVALLVALKSQWESVSTPPEVLALMQRVAESVVDSTPGYSTFLSLYAIVLLLNGRSPAALACGARALQVAGDDPRRRAEALFAHTRVDWVLTREGARVVEAAREGVRLARLAGARATEASALSLLGAITLWGLNEPTAAAELYRHAEGLYVALGNRRGALQSWHGQMGCLFQTGRYEDTIQLGRRLEQAAAALGNVEARLVALDLTAESLARMRRFEESLATARLEASLAQRHHRTYNLVYAVWHQGRSLARLRRPEEAAVIMAFAERYWQETLGSLGAEQMQEAARVKRLVRAQIGAARTEALWTRGRDLPMRKVLQRAGGA